MKPVTIRDGCAKLTVGAAQPAEAIDMATRYLELRGWIVISATVKDARRAKVGIAGLFFFRITAEVSR